MLKDYSKLFKSFFKSDSKIRNYSLYAIPLEKGKYYIGLTSRNPLKRINEHGTRRGAAWTRKYKPLKSRQPVIRKLGRIPEYKALNYENDLTNEYMKKYGRGNVRGGRMISTKFLFLRQQNPGTIKDFVQTFSLFFVFFIFIVLVFVISRYAYP